MFQRHPQIPRIFQIFAPLALGTCLLAATACGDSASSAAVKSALPAAESATERAQALQAAANPGDCFLNPQHQLECSLSAGTQNFHVDVGETTPVRLVNRSGGYLQINSVLLTTDESGQGKWGEFCTYLNVFDQFPDLIDPALRAPGQAQGGAGEVGCRHKKVGEVGYAALEWSGQNAGTGLSVAPDSFVVLNGHTLSNSPASAYLKGQTFRVVAAPQKTGVLAFRQPEVDHVFHCKDQREPTPWKSWTNTTGHLQYTNGATIYAVVTNSQPGAYDRDYLDSACLYIMTAAGQVRKSFCSPQYAVNKRGRISIPLQTIAPGEALAAQAANNCPASSHANWGYVAWFYVW